jgi:hypothetical protein
VQLTTQLFGVVPARFQYQDDEEDMITVTNDLELSEAVAVSVKSKSILRVFVIGMNITPPSLAPPNHIHLRTNSPLNFNCSHTSRIEAKGTAPTNDKGKEKPEKESKSSPTQDFLRDLSQMFNPSVIESLVASIPNLGGILSADGKGNMDVDLCDLFNKLKSTDVSSLPAPLANLMAQFGSSNPCEVFRNVFGKEKCGTSSCDAGSNNNNNSTNNGTFLLLPFQPFPVSPSNFLINFLNSA